MRTRHLIGLGFTFLALVPASALAWGDSCKFTADRAAGIDAQGVEKVVIRTGAGDLKVMGGARNVRIEARGKACATKQELLDLTQLTVRREGNTVYVETALPQDQTEGWHWSRNDYATLDTGIALPANIPVEAIDSSGDAVYQDLHSLKLQDSSGDLEIRRIAGLADINDSSGDVDLRDAGSARLNDSSGDLELADIHDEVVIDNDSSGDIRIAQAGGTVRIHNDSSGGIRVEDVKGDVIVDSDSSGDIHAERVTGNFTVSSDSSGSITHESIGGKVSVPGNKQYD